MQLTHAASIQAHVYTSDILGNTKFARGDLPGPAARLQTHVSVGK